jgi:phosphatidylglycerol:prolipoprotein diacylglycerol transferase
VIRFFIEFTRQPDAQLGFVLGPFSMGQLLSSLMIVAGTVLLAAKMRGNLTEDGAEASGSLGE